MPYPTCCHVKEDGQLCQGPAMRQQRYCYFHLSHRIRYRKMAQARARGENPPLYIPPLRDLNAVQASLTRVGQALWDGSIEPKQARTLLQVLRIAGDNLKRSKSEPATDRMGSHPQRPAPSAGKSLPATNLRISRVQ